MADIDWEFIYDSGSASPRPTSSDTSSKRALRGVTELNPTAVRRKSDGKIFKQGDCVLVASDGERPFVGMIHDFSFTTKGIVEVRTLWFTHPLDVLPLSKRRKDALEVWLSGN